MPGMGSHQSAAMLTDVWLTPPFILEALGRFDLDPCSSLIRPWPTADRHYTVVDDGLVQLWEGRVWLNPPYDAETGKWLAKLARHGDGIALIFARTETRMFFEHVWDKADALLFLRGRLAFHLPDGSQAVHNSGAPSVLVAYGRDNAQVLEQSGLNGKFVLLRTDA